MAAQRRKAPGSRDFHADERIAGKYRLVRRLAIGGMGQVWMARNLATHGDVALKLLRRGGSDPEREEEASQRFRNEARLSVHLAHRNIVRVYDLVEDTDGTLCLVMELLRGETAFNRLGRDSTLTTPQTLAVMLPVLGALSHAHEQGIVHRDVTPSNIFLAVDPDGHVTPKLVDFGLAKPVSEEAAPAVPIVHTVDGRVLGTPMYMAPERIRGERSIDARSDVFAAGVVIYELLTGQSPFAAPSPSASLAAVLERQVDPDPRIEPRVWLEIRRALSKQAYERHATARELSEALSAAAGATSGEIGVALAPPPGWNDSGPSTLANPSLPPTAALPVLGVPGSRPKALIGAAAAVGVLLVGLAVLAFSHRTTPTADAAGPTPASPVALVPASATAIAPVTAPPPPATTEPPAPPASEAPTAHTAPPSHSAGRPQKHGAGASETGKPRPVATSPGF
jgi:serine/threonine-protein kinase